MPGLQFDMMPAEPGESVLKVDGKFDGLADGLFPFRGDFVGELDCKTGKFTGMMQNADPMMMAMLGSQLMGMGQGQPPQQGMIPPPMNPAAMTPPPRMAMGAQPMQMWPDRMTPQWGFPMGGIRG